MRTFDKEWFTGQLERHRPMRALRLLVLRVRLWRWRWGGPDDAGDLGADEQRRVEDNLEFLDREARRRR